ncbi:hypothetical protein [Calothrix rhizosoleniae]|uniref:hypothetical protein n=1 Tax=Calothrix rhizosoleniae TaxID=888997 RepID=UPI000B4A278B|nr:hypothetical protein [Calothrix rhizosoleniae]
MTKLELKNHPVWHDLTEIVENLDASSLVQEHLKLSDYKICGYWDEQDEYYEGIILPHTLVPSFVSSSIGVTDTKRFLELKFVLLASSHVVDSQPNTMDNFGTLVLIYDENLEFVDENWVIDVNFPTVQAKRA